MGKFLDYAALVYYHAKVKALLGGKAASSHTHNYAGSGSAGGAANSANKLANARKISGVSFNGESDITIPNATQDVAGMMSEIDKLIVDNVVRTSKQPSLTITVNIDKLQETINSLPKRLHYDVVINVNPGTYNGTITIQDFFGNGRLMIYGANVEKITTHNVTNIEIIGNCLSFIYVRGFTQTNTTGRSIYITRDVGYVLIRYCNSYNGTNTDTENYGVYILDCSGNVFCDICEISNKYTAYHSAVSVPCYVASSFGVNNGIAYSVASGSIMTIAYSKIVADAVYKRVNGFIIDSALTNMLSGEIIDYIHSVKLGDEALKSITTGINNSALGFAALYLCKTGSYNTAIGMYALRTLNSGNYNSCIGYQAGRYVWGSSTTEITILSNISCLGANSGVSGSNQVQLGGSGDTVYGASAYNTRSDKRDKADISDLSYDALEFIKMLKPRNFRIDQREDYAEEISLTIDEYNNLSENEKSICMPVYNEVDNETSILTGYTYIRLNPRDGSKKRKRLHNGFIAQEVKEVMDVLNFDFAGWQNHEHSGGAPVQTLAYEEFIAPLVEAVQQLLKRVAFLEEKINEIQS